MARVESPWSPEGIFRTDQEDIGVPSDPGALAPARLPLEITNPPQPTDMLEHSRYKWTHSQVPYEVPITVLGGKPPFQFSISGIAGATVTGLAPSWNPKMVSAAEVYLPAGVQGTYAVTVTDQDGNSDSVSVTVQKNDGRFTFVDQNGSPSNPGTYENPKANMNDVWLPHTLAASPYKDNVIVFRAGSYTTPDDTASSGYVNFHSNKPRSLIGFPGESVTIAAHGNSPNGFNNNKLAGDTQYSPLHQIMFANVTLSGGGGWFIYRGDTSHNVYYDMTIRDVDMHRWTGSEDNLGGINYGSGYHIYNSFLKMNYINCISEHWNNQAAIQFYCNGKATIDIIESVDCTYSHTIYVKSSSQHIIVTSVSAWDTFERRGCCYSYNSGTQYTLPFPNVTSATNVVQYRYCRLLKLPDNNGQGDDSGDACVLVAHEPNKAYGQNYMDRCVLVAGIGPTIDDNPPADGVASATITDTVVINNQGWWGFHIPAFYNQSNVVTGFYKDNQWQNLIDSEGRVVTSDRYKIGWEI